MNKRFRSLELYVCGVLVTAFIVNFMLFKEKQSVRLKQCNCAELRFCNNQRTNSTFRQKGISEISHVEKQGAFRVDDSTFNAKQLSKTGGTRPHDRSNDTSRNQGDANTRSRLWSFIHVSDYVNYPCLPGSNESERLRSLNRCIRTVNVQFVADTVKSIECVELNVGTSIPICIHDPKIDKIISRSIVAKGVWEKTLLRIFLDALNKVKDIVVLDIGCNIGVYTLVAAREGKRVVSIDANVDNLRLLSKSLVLGQFRENVTLIWNAISDTYTNVSLKSTRFNIGAFSVNTNIKSISGNDVIIETILLDDIMYLFKGYPVGIKMDVEGFELHVLKGGETFLKTVDVRFIQMEITFHRGRESGKSIMTILQHYRFVPFATCLGDKTLVHLPMKKWPGDVCFIKNIEQFG